ncbi:MAG: hypothetical protein IPK80_14680 [Nannocystis sp.]|nr:hypothetical protein [Nannocystis sp.]
MTLRDGDSGQDNSDLNLLLSYAEEREPVLAEGLPHDSAGEERAEGDGLTGLSFYDLGAAGNDVGAQGWGVIAPEGKRGDELLARIQPLIAARGQMQDEPIRIYRVPPRMSLEEAQRWRQDVYNNDEPDKIPRYQLMLGDLHEVPLELQQVQNPEGFVGRLAFSDLEGYDAYVDKLLQWERSPSAVTDPKAVFYTVHDGTGATRVGHKGLIKPVVEQARAMKAEGRFAAGEIREVGRADDPTPDELFAAAAGLEAGVLFTMSHGEGAPRKGWSSARAQLLGQGAMSFGSGGHLPGRDIEGKVFAPGGVWFMFACFGAGTPTRSKFYHWLAQLAAKGQFRGRPDAVLASLPKGEQRPFIAALPQAALASPDGPLAVIGHLDLAWTYSFMEIDQGKSQGRPAKYYNLLKSLVRGDRVGVALQELERFYNDKNQELTDLYDLAEEAQQTGGKDPVDKAKIGHLWMVRQDLSGYILLGDPAAQLPLAPRSKKGRPRSETATLEVRSEPPKGPAAGKQEPAASFSAEREAVVEEDGEVVSEAPTAAVASEAPAAVASEAVVSEAPAAVSEAPAAVVSEDVVSEAPAAVVSEAPAAVVSEALAEPPPQPPTPRREAKGVRSGEVAGEVEIEGQGGTKIRWKIGWRLGG